MSPSRSSSDRAPSTLTSTSIQSRTDHRLIAALMAAAFALPLLGSSAAHARSQLIANYPYERVWPAALRFLRIDEGHQILEKDKEAGYVVFEVADDGKLYRGTLEVIRVRDDAAVKFVMQIADRPSYMESAMLKRLRYKLRQELGAPTQPKPKPKPEPKPEPKPDQGLGLEHVPEPQHLMLR